MTASSADPKSVLALRVLARRRIIPFAQTMYPEYNAGWVHRDIASRLERFYQDVKDKKSPRLMLNMPPRLGKSMLASTIFPSWLMGQDPKLDIILASYSADLPLGFSRKIRGFIRDDERYQTMFPQTMLSPDSQSAEAWTTTEGGSFFAAGIGGPLTGRGAHVLLIDDYIKNAEEADNHALHEKHLDWYQSTAYTRLAPGAGVIIIATRWSFADLSGKLQQLAEVDPDADRYEVVDYPAIAETYEYRHLITQAMSRSVDPINDGDYELLRQPGDVLHPERFSPQQVARIKANLSPRVWSALYQQKPAPDEGLFFRKEYLRRTPRIPALASANMMTAWDFAISTKNHNDYTAGVTLIQDENGVVFVESATRFKRDTYGIVSAIIDHAVSHMRDYPHYNYRVAFEDGQIFRAIQPVLTKLMREQRVFFSYEVLVPSTDKMVRARPLQALMQQGLVYFDESLPLLADIESELLQFPAGRHDDFVDALSWAARMVIDTPPPHRAEPRKHKSWKHKLTALATGGRRTFMGV